MTCLPRRQLLISALPAAGWAPGVGLAASASAALGVAPPLRVRYPRPMREIDPSSWYPLQLLKLALQACGVSCELQPTRQVMVQSRALLDLQNGQDGLDIAWSMTSIERERHLLPIRFPIYKGLYGWRLMLLKRGLEPHLLREVRSLADLRRYSLVQGHDWPDTAILRANGLQVVTGSSFDAMFSMLRLERGQAFPRALLEIDWELESHADSLAIDPHLCLHYPTAMYFFVGRGNERLAGLVERGLNRLLAKGSFERIFMQYHGAILARHVLSRRRVLELHNPLLPPETPLQRKELWMRP
ncbi:MAG: hypothetical protein CFE41_06535 [Burkholderiales bacterium PBB2]|nr:MAG: hypothetical protein CFE41_06535 [Burkholderiales bacterium PBB2]